MSGSKKLLIGVVVVVAAIVLLVFALAPRGPDVKTPETGPAVVEESVPSSPEDKQAFDRRKAASACRVAIMQSLKDPGTAQFVEELENTPWVAEDGGDYSFKILLKARNQTGLVSRQFACRAQPQAEGWAIKSLTEAAAP